MFALVSQNNFLHGSMSMHDSKHADSLSACNIEDMKDSKSCPLKENCSLHQEWWLLEYCYQAVRNFDLEALRTYAPKVSFDRSYIYKQTGHFPTPILTFATDCFIKKVNLHDKDSVEQGLEIIQFFLDLGYKSFNCEKNPSSFSNSPIYEVLNVDSQKMSDFLLKFFIKNGLNIDEVLKYQLSLKPDLPEYERNPKKFMLN